jgi:hypothetical protein
LALAIPLRGSRHRSGVAQFVVKRMKKALYLFEYVAVLLPTLLIAVLAWVEFADPPNPAAPDSFWVSRFGECLWFGLAFVLPACAVLAFNAGLKLLRRRGGDDSYDAA